MELRATQLPCEFTKLLPWSQNSGFSIHQILIKTKPLQLNKIGLAVHVLVHQWHIIAYQRLTANCKSLTPNSSQTSFTSDSLSHSDTASQEHAAGGFA